MTKNPRGVVRLTAVSLLLGFLWCFVLPHIATKPSVRSHLEWLEQRGIDPSAMYYTELEAMEPILHRLERRQPVEESHVSAFPVQYSN